MRKRKILKYAGMWVIKLAPVDVIDFELVEGDVIDIEDLCLLTNLKNKMPDNILAK